MIVSTLAARELRAVYFLVTPLFFEQVFAIEKVTPRAIKPRKRNHPQSLCSACMHEMTPRYSCPVNLLQPVGKAPV